MNNWVVVSRVISTAIWFNDPSKFGICGPRFIQLSLSFRESSATFTDLSFFTVITTSLHPVRSQKRCYVRSFGKQDFHFPFIVFVFYAHRYLLPQFHFVLFTSRYRFVIFCISLWSTIRSWMAFSLPVIWYQIWIFSVSRCFLFSLYSVSGFLRCSLFLLYGVYSRPIC